jgi:hypothetical protein
MGEIIGKTYLSFHTPKKNLSSSLHTSLLDKFSLLLPNKPQLLLKTALRHHAFSLYI